MTNIENKIFQESLSLPSDVRIHLVEELLRSLNTPTSKEIDKLWAKEAEHRINQIDNNEVELIPGDLVFSNLKKKWDSIDSSSKT